MCSWPTELRGPGVSYQNHFKSLTLSKDFEIIEANNDIISNNSIMNSFDIFWFYSPFDGALYAHLKNLFPNTKFWMGPNILLDKAERGISNEWEKSFVNLVESDIYCNNSNYYLERVLQYYKIPKKSVVLKYCMDLESFESSLSATDKEKKFDVLVYSKKRRIDDDFHLLYDGLISLLEKDEKITYQVIEYGSHSREEYFKKVKESKVTAWLSIEDYCSAAQLECQYLDCPIIGTEYNLTDTFDKKYWVDAQTMSSDEWIKWKHDAHIKYYDGIKKILEDYKSIVGLPSKFIKTQYSLESYGKYVKSVLDDMEW